MNVAAEILVIDGGSSEVTPEGWRAAIESRKIECTRRALWGRTASCGRLLIGLPEALRPARQAGFQPAAGCQPAPQSSIAAAKPSLSSPQAASLPTIRRGLQRFSGLVVQAGMSCHCIVRASIGARVVLR
jgi:hypothetical protein